MEPHYKPYEGLFITIEGGDGAGKSTLSKRLVPHFEKLGYSVIWTREPGGTPLAEKIRALLLDASLPVSAPAELMLFLAARVEHLEQVILPALRASKIVISERYNDSTVAYQGSARGLGMDYVEKLAHEATRGIEPDITLLLDVDPESALKRLSRKKDRMENEEIHFHRDVRSGYLHLADKYPSRIAMIDAGLSPEEIFKLSIKAIEPRLALKPHK